MQIAELMIRCGQNRLLHVEGHTAFAVLHCWCLGTPAPSPIGSATATLASVAAESSLHFSSSSALHFSPRGGAERRGDGCQLPRADQCTLQEESRDPGDASSSPDQSNLSSYYWNLDSFS